MGWDTYTPSPSWVTVIHGVLSMGSLFLMVFLLESVRVLVAYDSLTGNVEKMAEAVAEVYDHLSDFFSRKIKIIVLTILIYAALC